MKKPSFDSFTLSAVIAELQPLVGAKVQRISQTSELEIIIPLYAGSERFLLLSADPQMARAHLVTRFPAGLKPGPPFLATLRKSIQDGRLVFVRQRGLDRILEMGFTSPEGDFQIVAELMGKHSNVMLVDSKAKLIGAMKWVGPSQSRRPILPGKPYVPPPFEPKPPFYEALFDSKLTDFEGFSPFLGQLLAAGVPLTSLISDWRNKAWRPYFSEGFGAYPSSMSSLGVPEHAIDSISTGLEKHFSALSTSVILEGERRRLASQLNRLLLARETALAGVDEALQTAAQAPQLQKWGELILSYQGQIRPGDEQLVAWDYDGDEVTVPLRGDESPIENSNRYFHKARHAKERAADIAEQRDRLARDVSELGSLLSQLSEATTLREIEPLHDIATRRLWLRKASVAQAKEDRPYEGFSIKELLSPAGYRVLYGQNATSNDYLTTKVAKPNDLWFHVRGQTSAHVVLVTGNQPEKVQRPDVIFAAKVAARHSVAKHSGYVDVDYTLKKHVRKPRKSAPGAANYVNEKTITISEASVD